MSTILQASPKQFVSTKFTQSIVRRALRYLQSGFSVHLRGPAGTGKTTLAMHLASLLGRPMVMIYGDEDLRSSQIIGSQSGYSRKKVVDNFIHSVLKVEDDLQHTWVDARLTMAAREGFTLIYDEFNRSRPEANNTLLSALEEKLIVLPPDSNQSEYVRVHPQFRTIFTSNPEEYAGVHPTQDALLDRVITIDIKQIDPDTERQVVMSRTGLDRVSAIRLVELVHNFRSLMEARRIASLRAVLMIGKVCVEHNIPVHGRNPDFRDVCTDVLLFRHQGNPSAESILHQCLERMEEV
jgi:gas vesicle protein GvpN